MMVWYRAKRTSDLQRQETVEIWPGMTPEGWKLSDTAL